MLIFFYIRFAIVCSVLGIFGNGLTMFVLLANENLRKQSTTPFLLSLTLSDLIFCSFNLPLTAARLFYLIRKIALGSSLVLNLFAERHRRKTSFLEIQDCLNLKTINYILFDKVAARRELERG
jgi:hypothetical protein